jgi:hypothetical protein
MKPRVCSTLQRNINSKFLANVSFLNNTGYNMIFNFFSFSCTRDSYIKLFKTIKAGGFNNNFNRFLCPVENYKIVDHLKSLELKESKEEITINAIIINKRMINVYNKKEFFLQLIKTPNLSLLYLNKYLSSFLMLNLQFHLKFLIIQLNNLITIKSNRL